MLKGNEKLQKEGKEKKRKTGALSKFGVSPAIHAEKKQF